MQSVCRTLPLSALALLVAAGAARAQHTETVFLGEANPLGVNLPAERKAVHPVTAPYFHEDSFVITDGLGLEWRFSDSLALRGAYEYPLTDNIDLFGDRYTASLVWAF